MRAFFLLGILRQVRGVPAVGEKRVVKEKLTFNIFVSFKPIWCLVYTRKTNFAKKNAKT